MRDTYDWVRRLPRQRAASVYCGAFYLLSPPVLFGYHFALSRLFFRKIPIFRARFSQPRHTHFPRFARTGYLPRGAYRAQQPRPYRRREFPLSTSPLRHRASASVLSKDALPLRLFPPFRPLSRGTLRPSCRIKTRPSYLFLNLRVATFPFWGEASPRPSGATATPSS